MKDEVPKESETIAARRAKRLSDKLKKAREQVGIGRARWSSGVLEVLIVLLIFVLNFYLVSPFFGKSAPDAFFSGPVIPLLAKIVELFRIPISYSIQVVNIFFFITFPLSLYLFVKFVTERKLIALLAVLIASLPFYPFGEVRVTAALIGVDSAHIASLSVIPIALYGVISFIRKGRTANLIVASVFSSLVALISPFGFMAYLIFAGFVGFSEMLLGRGRVKIFRLLAILFFSAGLISFWYNPGFFIWMISGPLGLDIRSTISRLIPISLFTIPILGAFGYLLFDRKPNLQPVFLATFLTIAFAIMAVAGGGIFPSHPSRYVPELGIALSMLIAIGIVKFIDFIKLSGTKRLTFLTKINKQVFANGILVLVVLALVGSIIGGRSRLTKNQNSVLGLWTEVERGDIWKAKDRFRGFSTYLGYAITGGSAVGLGLISKMKKTVTP